MRSTYLFTQTFEALCNGREFPFQLLVIFHAVYHRPIQRAAIVMCNILEARTVLTSEFFKCCYRLRQDDEEAVCSALELNNRLSGLLKLDAMVEGFFGRHLALWR